MPITVDRKTEDEPLFLDSPFLAITGTIQPDTLQSLLHESRRKDGFIDRILFAYPDAITPLKWSEPAVEDETIDEVDTLFQRLYGLQFVEDATAKPITLDPDATGLWARWYDASARTPGHPGPSKGAVGEDVDAVRTDDLDLPSCEVGCRRARG